MMFRYLATLRRRFLHSKAPAKGRGSRCSTAVFHAGGNDHGIRAKKLPAPFLTMLPDPVFHLGLTHRSSRLGGSARGSQSPVPKGSPAIPHNVAFATLVQVE